MDFYPKDFFASTAFLSFEQKGVYLLMLALAWTHEASLPRDPERIREALAIPKDAWRRIWPALEEKWPVRNGLRRNPRQSEIWQSTRERHESWTARGRKGNAIRWGSLKDPPAIAKGSLSPSPSPSPSPPSLIRKGVSISEDLRRRFAPPTVEQVAEEISRKGFKIDPVAFVAHYEAKGWKIGKTPMKSWRAALVTWSRRDKNRESGIVPGRPLPADVKEFNRRLGTVDAETYADLFRRRFGSDPVEARDE
jgi:uncharacterized protein YdaU (DUF1376 family)